MEVEIEKKIKTHKEVPFAADITDREEQKWTLERKQDNEQHASNEKEYVVKLECWTPENLWWHPRSHGHESHIIGQTDWRDRRPSTKDVQEAIQFEQVDFE